jgi:hypothetical protein
MIEKTQENTSFVINETPKACSYEVGKAGARHKIYYENVEDLKKQIKELKEAGFLEEETPLPSF